MYIKNKINKEMNEENQPTVAIVGRPNVGKSTFFNRLCGKRKAIESAIPNTTIDRIYGQVFWAGKNFSVIDTAGINQKIKIDSPEVDASAGIEIALKEADLIIFLIDTNEIQIADREIAKKLHRSGKNVLLAANKADNSNKEIASKETLSLGFGHPHFVSAISGRGVGDLLDQINKLLPNHTKKIEKNDDTIKLSLIGRPNVGKSTMLNSMTKTKRAIVSEKPGTTRDTNDIIINKAGRIFEIVDTAGIRRRGKIEKEIERFSIIRATQAIKESEIIILIIDAKDGITNQDAHIAGMAKDMGKSIIIAVNKIDIFDDLGEKKKQEEHAKIISKLQKDFAFLPYVPIIFTSGMDEINIDKIFTQAKKIHLERNTLIEKSEMKKIAQEASDNNHQFPRYLSFFQEKSNPPVFKMIVKNKKSVHFSHLRYMENFIRNYYPFIGTPIFIDVIEKTSSNYNPRD